MLTFTTASRIAALGVRSRAKQSHLRYGNARYYITRRVREFALWSYHIMSSYIRIISVISAIKIKGVGNWMVNRFDDSDHSPEVYIYIYCIPLKGTRRYIIYRNGDAAEIESLNVLNSVRYRQRWSNSWECCNVDKRKSIIFSDICVRMCARILFFI